MGNWKKSTESLKAWFEAKAKPPLQALRRDDVIQTFASDVQSLERKAEREDDLFQICVLGRAGVGKSTLINTLVAGSEIVVPSGGGAGPMTATALRVGSGKEKRFSVLYHGKQKINLIRFAIEVKISREQQSLSPEVITDESQITESENLVEHHEQGTEEDKSKSLEEFLRAAKQILGVSQEQEDKTDEYLVDGLRSIQGLKLKFSTSFANAQIESIKLAKEAIDLGSKKKWKAFENSDQRKFSLQLNCHATGSLAPLVDEIRIEWPSDLLHHGIEIVDLPGVGIHNDHYERVTKDFLRNKARALMLVIDSRGTTEADARILKESTFLDRLLFSLDDPKSDPVPILMAVTNVDDVAKSNWLNDKALNGTPELSKHQHFLKISNSLPNVVSTQLKGFLESSWRDADGQLSDSRKKAIDRVMGSLQVFPISAPQYVMMITSDSEDQPFLKTEEATQIPQIKSAIADLAASWFEERQLRFESETKSFFDLVGSRLKSEGAAIEESLSGESQSTQLLEELNLFISPLKDQFQIRLGGFGNFLNSAIRERIRAGVLESTNLARRQMLAYVNTLTKYPWNTLRAAVRKSGTFVGSRRVDLRGEFSSAFISPMASVWSTQILSEIKTKTNAFAEYQEQAIREIIGWARSNKLRPSTRLLDALAEEIKQNRIRLVGVGKNAVSELREKVKEKLYESVQEPIDSECRKFVRRGNDVGAGVLGRMHELLYDLVEKVADELNETVESLLLEQFRVVAKEIREALREDYNPLDDATARLIPRIESVSQKEIEKSKSILASIYHAVESVPSVSKETAKAA